MGTLLYKPACRAGVNFWSAEFALNTCDASKNPWNQLGLHKKSMLIVMYVFHTMFKTAISSLAVFFLVYLLFGC